MKHLQGLDHSRSPEQPAQVICDSWVSDPTTTPSASEDQRSVRGDLAAGNGSGPNMPVSYFEMYKNRMKKLKEAGLRADVQTVNISDGGNMPERPRSLSLRDDSLYSPHDDSSFDDYAGNTRFYFLRGITVNKFLSSLIFKNIFFQENYIVAFGYF